jgi:methylated-DNA-[protein]-cysteine S-methyltransferase
MMITMLEMRSPLGPLRLFGTAEALSAVYLPTSDAPQAPAGRGGGLALARRQLDEYFAGDRRDFDLPLEPEGTAFQQRVWRALLAIPYGTTCSYGELARAIGRPAASRAVGAANGKNPLAIIVPCHRVIGANGTLTGYGGGLPIKRWLLGHEQKLAGSQLVLPANLA